MKREQRRTDQDQDAAQDDEQDADSLLAELEGTPVDLPEDDTHPTQYPHSEGVSDALDTHIIPHNRIAAETDMDDNAIQDAEWSPSLPIDADGLPQDGDSGLVTS